jgi:hypothetical protein
MGPLQFADPAAGDCRYKPPVPGERGYHSVLAAQNDWQESTCVCRQSSVIINPVFWTIGYDRRVLCPLNERQAARGLCIRSGVTSPAAIRFRANTRRLVATIRRTAPN